MKLRKFLENWDMTGLKVNTGFLEMEWAPQEKDREAAWELYVEMLTRIVTQPLPKEHGDEKSALESVHSLFPTTREILRRKGRECVQLTKIAVIVLNQIVRPFTTKWHSADLNAFGDATKREDFRKDLEQLQKVLKDYTRALADIAQVEDLTTMNTP
ncbi:hypothetical protein DES53_10380 [Roseimicrobium gellanilyticum]|uniref:Uncharacterized protein n=1 Tax=Roseimicrobium gellanilyticum TaxID=748857 RepID=A0A366HPP3_9BACT|nr:hypothetical protein [Roseimicrobium gellanilyticum]RBP45084.1 hypothetical protein DES53_10380 [Roseimicrobium gellanilyticum]